MPTSRVIYPLLFLAIGLLGGPGIGHAENVTPADRDQFKQQLDALKQRLAALPQKIQDTLTQAQKNDDPSDTRRELDALMQTVSGLLVTLADNGDLTRLGQAIDSNAHQKLNAALQDTHFSRAEKDYLVTQWKDVVARTDKSVAGLEAARKELAEMLRQLQTKRDYLAQLDELEKSSENIDLINALTASLKELSDSIQTILTTIPGS